MKPTGILAGVILFAAFAAAATAGPGQGDPAPDFCEPDTAYVVRCLSDYRGNCILLNFWESTWTGCLAELPSLEDIYNDYHTFGFEVITVNCGESMSTVRDYARQYSYLFLLDADLSTWSIYAQTSTIPLNYVIDNDPNMTVVYYMEGFSEPIIRFYIELSLEGVQEDPRSEISAGSELSQPVLPLHHHPLHRAGEQSPEPCGSGQRSGACPGRSRRGAEATLIKV